MIDPQRDAEKRGIAGRGLELPVLENSIAHHEVMCAHAERYLRAYYPDDAALAADVDVQRWFAQLDRLVPNGVGAIGDTTTVEAASRLIGSLIHLVSYQHEAYGTLLWNYQPWTQVQPIRVAVDGSSEPVDVYQRLINADFGLNIRRSPMMQDFSYLATRRPRQGRVPRVSVRSPRAADATRAGACSSSTRSTRRCSKRT